MGNINLLKIRPPLRKIGPNKIVLDVPSMLEQCTTIYIVSVIFLVLFSFLMLFTSKVSENTSDMIGLLSIIWGVVICFGIMVFAIKLRLYFDLDNQEITKEGTIFNFPYKSVWCKFYDISTITVRCKKVKNKGRYFYEYDLGYSTGNNFIVILPKDGIKINYTVDQLNKIGKNISDIVGCNFLSSDSPENPFY